MDIDRMDNFKMLGMAIVEQAVNDVIKWKVQERLERKPSVATVQDGKAALSFLMDGNRVGVFTTAQPSEILAAINKKIDKKVAVKNQKKTAARSA